MGVPPVIFAAIPPADLQPARLDLRLITVHNHVENLLTPDEAIGCVIDISVRADNRYTKVAHSVGVGYRARIGQDYKWNVRARDQTGLPRERDEEQRISCLKLSRPAIQLFDLPNEQPLIRILGKNQH